MPIFLKRDTQTAKSLRSAAAPAEPQLWRSLSHRQTRGCKFSRQIPIGPYCVNCLCREHRLIVEVDDYSHDLTIEHDLKRSPSLERHGFHVMRFSNADAQLHWEGVLTMIGAALVNIATPHSQPLPQAGRETSAP